MANLEKGVTLVLGLDSSALTCQLHVLGTRSVELHHSFRNEAATYMNK